MTFLNVDVVNTIINVIVLQQQAASMYDLYYCDDLPDVGTVKHVMKQLADWRKEKTGEWGYCESGDWWFTGQGLRAGRW